MKKKPDETAEGPFDANTVLCTQCEEKPATHEISISCNKGTIYSTDRRPVFHITYSVCGGCARNVVEVKLAADLRVRESLKHDNTIESLRAELKAVRECAQHSLNNAAVFPNKEALRKIAQGVVR